MEAEREGVAAGERIHVRRLDVVDTFRWSWDVLTDHRELVALAFAVQLLSVGGTSGVSRSSPPGVPETSEIGGLSALSEIAETLALPEIADWVLPVSVVYLLGLGVVWGVCYLTAANAVAERERPLRSRVVRATKRVPALVGITLLLWPLVSVGFVLFVIPGVYLFHRLMLAYAACVIDRKGPVASLRASWSAAGGSVWKIFGATLVYGLLVLVLTSVGSFFGGAYSVVNAGVRAVFSSVLIPLFGLALGHLYLEGSRNT